MKFIFKALFLSFLGLSLLSLNACKDDDETPEAPRNFTVFGDQMARPAINTVFIASGAPKDAFNSTIPSAMSAAYASTFQNRLLALNAGYTTNALGQDAATFTGLLVTDVLNVSTSNTTPTTFFDGTNVLTGRALADDVIDTDLLLIFGGPAGTDNPTLTSDNVDANDKTFLTTFPYLASPH
ncbi:MAG: DUF4331 family protein [Microscillaceae bacterium]|nr:DUF4331 family protein [Microscillaceae bacterium]